MVSSFQVLGLEKQLNFLSYVETDIIHDPKDYKRNPRSRPRYLRLLSLWYVSFSTQEKLCCRVSQFFTSIFFSEKSQLEIKLP